MSFSEKCQAALDDAFQQINTSGSGVISEAECVEVVVYVSNLDYSV